MKAILLALVVATTALADEPSTPAVPPKTGKEVLVIKESKDAQTFNAEGQDVTINGNRNKVTITGTCHALTVSGDKNSVTVAAVTSISITGAENQVIWGKAVDGAKPQVTDQGKDNLVTQRKD